MFYFTCNHSLKILVFLHHWTGMHQPPKLLRSRVAYYHPDHHALLALSDWEKGLEKHVLITSFLTNITLHQITFTLGLLTS